MPIEARIEARVNMPDGVESKVNVARGNMSNAGQMRQEGICQMRVKCGKKEYVEPLEDEGEIE